MAVVGDNVVGTSGTDFNDTGNIAVAGPFTAEASGPLGSGWLYLSALNGTGIRTQKMRMTIWLDNGSGTPGSFVGATDEITITDTTTTGAWVQFPGWNSLGRPSIVTTGPGYHVGAWWGTQTAAAQVVVVNGVGGLKNVNASGAETYSSTGPPPVVPTNPGGNLTYSAYFDIPAFGVGSQFVTHLGGRGGGW